MATVTLTIPDANLPLVADAMAARYGWSSDMGITKSAFIKQVFIRIAKEAVEWYEPEQAAKTALKTNVNVT